MAVMLVCVPLGFACGAIYPCVLNVLMNYSGNRKATAAAMMILSSCFIVSLAAALTAVFGEKLFIKNQK